MKEVQVLARFPEERYRESKHGSPLEILGAGKGSTLAVAIGRAVRSILKDSRIRGKSPLHVWMAIGIDGEQAIPFWRSVSYRISP